METLNQEPLNLEDAMTKLFAGGVSGTGEEELLRIAKDFGKQFSGFQIQGLMLLHHLSERYKEKQQLVQAKLLDKFIIQYVEYKQFQNSDVFVMRALEAIAMRRLIGENTLKINLEKK